MTTVLTKAEAALLREIVLNRAKTLQEELSAMPLSHDIKDEVHVIAQALAGRVVSYKMLAEKLDIMAREALR